MIFVVINEQIQSHLVKGFLFEIMISPYRCVTDVFLSWIQLNNMHSLITCNIILMCCCFFQAYGGFLSTLLLLSYSSVFKCGIAVAPITNWRLYGETGKNPSVVECHT